MVTCLGNEPKCEGELIEKFRYWMLQMAMMDNILVTCKDKLQHCHECCARIRFELLSKIYVVR